MTSTSTVHIAPVALHHAPAIQRWAADPLIAETTRIPHPYPENGAVEWIQRAMGERETGTSYAFAVLLGTEVIGSCGIHDVQPTEAEMGYWIARPYWGRGFATQAAQQVTYFALHQVGLRRVYAFCLARNPASARVLTKSGFRYIGSEMNTEPHFYPDDLLWKFERLATG